MSTPMFIREPDIGSTAASGLSHAAYPPAWAGAVPPLLLDGVTEAWHVEEIGYSAIDFSTLVGMGTLWLVDDVGTIRCERSFEIAAGTATLWASGRVAVDITVPVGWSLGFSHDVQDGVGYVVIHCSAHGGIVR